MRFNLLLTAVLGWYLLPGLDAKSTAVLDSSASLQCSSTTINYITQTLPQQCLRTDWSRPGSDSTATSSSPPPNNHPAIPSDGHDRAITTTSAADRISSKNAKSQAADLPEASLRSTSSTTSSTTSPTAGGTDVKDEEDGDPLSDQGSFLSFEQWKAQMLEKAGQSPDHVVGTVSSGEDGVGNRRRQPGIQNALDSLGEEGEIELDFGSFVRPDNDPGPASAIKPEQAEGSKDVEEQPTKPPAKRSKEAGTTSKERFNYASFDCAATVLKTNTGSKGATWILSENKDSYLLNKCSEKSKYFIVELCNDILIDTIVLGNFEFFSSTFRHFKVSISDRYPIKSDKWRTIGTFEARNTRGVQAFLVENGLIWARYLKVEMLTHYGKEYYCPVSLLRVHGKTMMDDYRNEMKDAHEQDDGEEEDESSVEGEVPDDKGADTIAVPPVPGKVLVASDETLSSVAMSTVYVAPVESPMTSFIVEAPKVDPQPSTAAVHTPIESSESERSLQDTSHSEKPAAVEQSALSNNITPTQQSIASNIVPTVSAGAETIDGPTAAMSVDPKAIDTVPTGANHTAQVPFSTASIAAVDSIPSPNLDAQTAGTSATTSEVQTSIAVPSKSAVSIVETSEESATVASPSQDTSTGKIDPIATGTKSSDSTVTGSSTKSRSTKTLTPIKAAPVPATQDSFFRSIHRRLQMLESNSTLSLQYIEEQSRILRDAFGKAEKRQLLRSSNFLETLNSTVLGELRNFRTQYDQIWQSTVLELASQREQSQKEVRALGERLGLLADELVWQKRVVYLQFVLLVLCLGLVIFSRNGIYGGSNAAPLELSLLQSLQNLGRSGTGASVSFAKKYPSSPDSGPGTPSRPGSMGGLFRRKSGHVRYASDGITSGDDTGIGTETATSPEQQRRGGLRVHDGGHSRSFSEEAALADDIRSKSPSVDLQPVTPLSERDAALADRALGVAEHGDGREDGLIDVPEADPIALKRAASSPVLGHKSNGEGADDGDGDDDNDGPPEQTNTTTISFDAVPVPSITETLVAGTNSKS